MAREIACAGSAHRAESLHDRAQILEVPALVLRARGRRFRDAISADDVGQADALDLDGESLRHAASGSGRIARTIEHRLHGHAHALLGEHLVEQLLRDAEILGCAPTAPVQRRHRADEAREHAARFGVVRVDVHAALCSAAGQVECAVLVRHRARESLDLFERDAGTHACAAARESVNHSINDRVALAARHRVGPDHAQPRFLRCSRHVTPLLPMTNRPA